MKAAVLLAVSLFTLSARAGTVTCRITDSAKPMQVQFIDDVVSDETPKFLEVRVGAQPYAVEVSADYSTLTDISLFTDIHQPTFTDHPIVAGSLDFDLQTQTVGGVKMAAGDGFISIRDPFFTLVTESYILQNCQGVL